MKLLTPAVLSLAVGWCCGPAALVGYLLGLAVYLLGMDYLDTYRDVLVLADLVHHGPQPPWAVQWKAQVRGTSCLHLLGMLERGLVSNDSKTVTITPLGRSYLDGYGRRRGYVLPGRPL